MSVPWGREAEGLRLFSTCVIQSIERQAKSQGCINLQKLRGERKQRWGQTEQHTEKHWQIMSAFVIIKPHVQLSFLCRMLTVRIIATFYTEINSFLISPRHSLYPSCSHSQHVKYSSSGSGFESPNMTTRSMVWGCDQVWLSVASNLLIILENNQLCLFMLL